MELESNTLPKRHSSAQRGGAYLMKDAELIAAAFRQRHARVTAALSCSWRMVRKSNGSTSGIGFSKGKNGGQKRVFAGGQTNGNDELRDVHFYDSVAAIARGLLGNRVE
jgi:hypothetical protein